MDLNNVTFDSGWCYTAHANPRRGWHDYIRTFQIKRELSKEEIEEWVRYLDTEKHCPAGQGRPTFSSQAPSCDGFTLQFRCFCDSGD